MTEYKIENQNGEYVVVSNDIVYGAYDVEHKAKRRIRDLKAKEANAALMQRLERGNLIVPVIVPVPPTPFVRQVGCYPAISKHSYQR